MQGFEYPTEPHVRRHGPEGYTDYGSYRDWLRDEFTFRCVYCLHREQWSDRAATFHIDHLIPVSVDPQGECEYTNLLYACVTCNFAKRAILDVPDPCHVAFGECLRIQENGEFTALDDRGHGKKLLEVLLLNSKSNVRQRSRWMRTLAALRSERPELFQEYMGFPENLPDLRRPKKRVTRNTKPEGAMNCYFVLRERGKLPATY